jgi:tol-pal system protein YbgF
VNAFRQLATAFPTGVLADNTQYWLGEAYYVMRDYDHAAACFEAVLSGWPGSRKAPDALLKLGYTQFEQKKAAAARLTLQQVGARFPGTDAARLAAERLQKMAADAR